MKERGREGRRGGEGGGGFTYAQTGRGGGRGGEGVHLCTNREDTG